MLAINPHMVLVTTSFGAFGFALYQALLMLRRMRASRTVPEPFTAETHRAMVMAGRTAGRYRALTPADVLVGLLKTRNVACELLGHLDVRPRQLLRELGQLRAADAGPAGSLSVEVRRALATAAQEAHAAQSCRVGTVQLLLGVLKSAPPDLCELLSRHHVSPDAVERALNLPAVAARAAAELHT